MSTMLVNDFDAIRDTTIPNTDYLL